MDVLEHIKWVINGCLVKCTKYFLSKKFIEYQFKISTLKSRFFASSVVNFLDQAPCTGLFHLNPAFLAKDLSS